MAIQCTAQQMSEWFSLNGPLVRLAHGKVCVLVSGVGGRDGGDDEATAAGRTDATLPDHPTDRRGR